jgi:sugar fermentation stimulation protein A
MARPAAPAISVRYRSPPVRVEFLRRPNRYLAEVRRERDGRRLAVHVPNPGRMEELLVAGARGYAIPMDGLARKTHLDLVSVEHDGHLVSIDSRIANRLVARAIGAGGAQWLRRGAWRPEVRLGHHRIDFGRHDARSGALRGLLEVKSSNLSHGRTALFPDAPTLRGAAHLRALTAVRSEGVAADVVFVIQHAFADRFAPNRAMDPAFATAFDVARAAGVRMHAQTLEVHPDGVTWRSAVPVVPGAVSELIRERQGIDSR